MISDGNARTQIEIARTLGIDKTTLMSILDGLEREGHVVRTTSPTNRRIKIPAPRHRACRSSPQVMDARDAAVNERLGLLREGESEVLRVALWRLANAPLGLTVAVVDTPPVDVAQPQP